MKAGASRLDFLDHLYRPASLHSSLRLRYFASFFCWIDVIGVDEVTFLLVFLLDSSNVMPHRSVPVRHYARPTSLTTFGKEMMRSQPRKQ